MKLWAIGITLLASVCAAHLGAQTQQKETTAEEAYYNSGEELTVEGIIISKLADGGLDGKREALAYAEAAINAGKITPSVSRAVEKLAGETTLSASRLDGRELNNFVIIRMEACALLGKIATEEVKNTLKKIAYADNEPLVAAAAVRSLGEIGMNDEKNDVLETIVWVEKKFSVLKPSSGLAQAVLAAFEAFAPQLSPEQSAVVIQSLASIAANHDYIAPVRERAAALMKSLPQAAGQGA